MRRRYTKLAALIAATTAVAGLVGGVAPAGAAKQPVVTIGVIAPLDAGLTSFGQGIANSTQLAVDQANQSKAIPGWTIKYKEVNDSSDGRPTTTSGQPGRRSSAICRVPATCSASA